MEKKVIIFFETVPQCTYIKRPNSNYLGTMILTFPNFIKFGLATLNTLK